MKGFLRKPAFVLSLWLVTAISCAAATLNRYPYIQDARSGRVTIMWTTQERGSGVVQFSKDQTFSQTALAHERDFLPAVTGLPAAFTQHAADLTGLAPVTEYFYRILHDGVNLLPGADLRFRTPGPGPFKFLIFGDSGWNGPEQKQLAAVMTQRETPDLVIHTGDIAYMEGNYADFETKHFAIYKDLMKRVPFFPCLGNHEYGTKKAAPAVAVHSVPREGLPLDDRGRYYSFDWGNVHFVSIDANDPLLDAVNKNGVMLEWLENDLERSQKFWKIVYWHQPPYITGINANDPLAKLARDRIVPILEKYNVPLVFNGHEHSYQRTKFIRNGNFSNDPSAGTIYLTTGGGGALLYPFTPHERIAFGLSTYHYVRAETQGSKITFHAIDSNGQEFDTFTVAPPPKIAANSMVNAATFTAGVAPGSLVSIFGTQLAPDVGVAAAFPLPSGISGLSVTWNGKPLPLLFVSATQINAQMPYDAPGTGALRVATGNGFSETAVTVSESAPGIFMAGSQPIALHGNNTLITTTAPAAPGEEIVFYLTGLGAVDGSIAAGQPAPSSPLLRVTAPVLVEFDEQPVTPAFAGLTPGFAGLYQVNVQVPPQFSDGTHQVRIFTGNNGSNTVGLSVKAP